MNDSPEATVNGLFLGALNAQWPLNAAPYGLAASGFDGPNDEGASNIEVVRFRSLEDIRSNLSGTQYLIKPLLERDTVTVLYGDSDTYKSFLAIDIGLSVAHGVDFAGFRVHQGAVFYVCGEGQGGIGRRVEAWHIARKVHEHDAPFFVSELPAALMDDGNACALAQGIGFRIADLGRDDPALIVIDTLSQNFGDGDESKNADVSTFLSNINVHLRARYRCAVIIIHHVGHGDKDRERGAYAIRGNADARILVQRRKEPMTVEMTCRKMKDGPSFDPLWL